METIIYGLIFIIGTLFGSFSTLAVYRIPLGLNILYEHSFCPNCKNKLKFMDLIPILSYISLGGKCRYCGQKVRARYLVLEVLSGLTFLLFALSLKFNVLILSVNDIIYFSFFALYFVTIFIIAGIDKEKGIIQKSVLLFGLIISICFMVYVCISKAGVIYTYIIFLVFIMLILILDIIFCKKYLHENYTISILVLSLCMIVFSGSEIYYYTAALSLLVIGLTGIFEIIKNSKKRKTVMDTQKNKDLKIPLGFYMAISNIFLIILYNFLR